MHHNLDYNEAGLVEVDVCLFSLSDSEKKKTPTGSWDFSEMFVEHVRIRPWTTLTHR